MCRRRRLLSSLQLSADMRSARTSGRPETVMEQNEEIAREWLLDRAGAQISADLAKCVRGCRALLLSLPGLVHGRSHSTSQPMCSSTLSCKDSQPLDKLTLAFSRYRRSLKSYRYPERPRWTRARVPRLDCTSVGFLTVPRASNRLGMYRSPSYL